MPVDKVILELLNADKIINFGALYGGSAASHESCPLRITLNLRQKQQRIMPSGGKLGSFKINESIASFIIITLLVISALITFCPANTANPDRDSGVFLYIGKQILNGAIPYRDVWDHKPPAVFYLDALGLLIGRGSMWGVWFLQFISLLFAGFLGHLMLKRNFGIVASLFGSTFWLSNFIVISSRGNVTEIWALPFQFLALYFF